MKIGIDLGGSHIAIGVVNNLGRIQEKIEKRILPKEKNNIKNVIEEYIITNVKNFTSKYQITELMNPLKQYYYEKRIHIIGSHSDIVWL